MTDPSKTQELYRNYTPWTSVPGIFGVELSIGKAMLYRETLYIFYYILRSDSTFHYECSMPTPESGTCRFLVHVG